jgi:hypothetical protein
MMIVEMGLIQQKKEGKIWGEGANDKHEKEKEK